MLKHEQRTGELRKGKETARKGKEGRGRIHSQREARNGLNQHTQCRTSERRAATDVFNTSFAPKSHFNNSSLVLSGHSTSPQKANSFQHLLNSTFTRVRTHADTLRSRRTPAESPGTPCKTGASDLLILSVVIAPHQQILPICQQQTANQFEQEQEKAPFTWPVPGTAAPSFHLRALCNTSVT